MRDNSLRELFPSSERFAIGGSDPRGTNTVVENETKVRDQVYMVIMKLKEHKNLAIRAKVMEYLSRMNKEDVAMKC
jgi:3-methyladenine DNA glycosylase AlkC